MIATKQYFKFSSSKIQLKSIILDGVYIFYIVNINHINSSGKKEEFI